MYHQNWLEEMDQIGCCNGSKSGRRSSKKNKSTAKLMEPQQISSSSSITNSTTAIMNKSMRLRNKGGGSWRSHTSHYNSSSVVPVFWLILSVGSSMAVMAYQNDLSASSSSSISGTGKSSNSASSSSSSRHGCVWSRTDTNSVGTTASTTTTTSASYLSGMYAGSGGNNPFHHQQPQHSFPALSSSSSSMSPYYSSSILASGFSGGSSSTSGGGGVAAGGNGVLTLDCNVRTLNAPDLHNYTASFTREQVEQARAVRVKCSDKLFFESVLSPNQSMFQLRNLQEVQIDSCKIRRVPKLGVFSTWTQLRRLKIQTDNVQWSPSVGLEIESGAFQGLGQLESLDLSYNNIWTLFPDPNVLCPMRNLVKLNVSRNRLTDVDEFGLDSDSSNGGGGGGAGTEANYYCALSVQNLDLSFNSLRRFSGFSRLRRLVELRLRNNILEELEDSSLSGLSQLKLLDLSSNRLVALPPTLFTNSRNLREVYLQNNSISALSPQVFTGLDQLLLLDLSRNSLTSMWVRDSIFSGLVRLIVLNLSDNKLTSIDATIFTDLISAQALDLSNNLIESIHRDAFQNLKNLHSLDLSKNRLTTAALDSRLFSSLFVLRTLFLDHNEIHQMDDPNLLKNCTSLQDMGLANNKLTQVPVALRGLRQLKTLDIGENRISSVNGSFNLPQIYGLRLVDNIINELPHGFCESMKNLRVLNVAQNRISKISDSAFLSCPHLRALRLDSNAILELPLTTLASQLPSLLWLNVSENRIRRLDYTLLPSTLEWLDVSHNQLESMKPGNFPSQSKQQQQSRNSSAFSLRVLDASYNNLGSLDYTTIPPSLEILRLNNNQLRTVAENTFSRATRLRRVEMKSNQLEKLELSAIRFPQIAKGQSLPEMYLGNNPFACHCSLEWLTRVNQLSVLRQHPRIVDLDAIVCRPVFPRSTFSSGSSSSLSLSSLASSSSLSQVIPLVEARPKDFLCPYKSHCFALCQCCEFDACDCEMTCPGNCTCYHDTAWSANIVECSNLAYTQIPSRIPMDATEIYLDGNKMTELGSHIFIGKKNLRSLFLNGSQIETIRNKTFNGLKSLEVLDLSANLLSEIQGYEFADLGESLRELYLHNNLLRHISKDSFSRLKLLTVLRIDGNWLVDFNAWELTGNGYLNSVMLARNPWSCDCEFLIPFKRWVAGLTNTIVLDFALAKCQQPTEQQEDGHNSSSAILNSGGSAITVTGSTTTTATITTTASDNAAAWSISSMCTPFTQTSFNYNSHDPNPALLPSAASSSSSNGGSNHVLLMNNHISSMGGAGRNNLGSLQLQAGNYHQGFPQNENIIATTAAAGGGGLRRSKTGHGSSSGRGGGGDDHDDDADGSSGNSTFFTLLLTFIAVILVASIAFLVGLVTFRKRGRLSQSSSSATAGWWCFSKCGINGGSSAQMLKCLSAPNSSAANDGASTGTPGLGGNSADMDYYYYSDQEKLFDAYFIYSQKDEEFVTEKLTCELERSAAGAPIIIHPHQQHYYPAAAAATLAGTKKLRLCLHYRDLCLAPDNPWSSEMILSACDASKRVVLVISNNFLNGEWTNNHFRTSVLAAIQQHCRKLIVIKFPPVSDQSVSSICSSVTAAAEQQQRLQPQQRNNNCGGGVGSTTCIPGATTASNKQSSFTSSLPKLEWGDQNFWPKFRLLLPTPQHHQQQQQIPSSTGNNNRNDTNMPGNYSTMASSNSQLPYTTSLNHNGRNFVNAANNGPILPYQIPMIASPHHYHQPSDPVSALVSAHSQQHQQQQQQQPHQPPFITLMNWTGQQHHHTGIPSLPLGHSSSVHPVPSQLTPQHFGYSNIDGFHPNNMSSQQSIIFPSQPQHFSSSNNNNRQSYRQQQSHPNHVAHQHHLHHHHHNGNHNNPTGHGQHIHSLSQLSNMSSGKSPMEVNYSSSAVSSGNEEFDHVYSTLDSPLESPCSDLGPGHVAGQFEGAMISGAQVNRHQIQHSTSSGISSGSDATSGTGGCHAGGGGGNSSGGPPMYFV